MKSILSDHNRLVDFIFGGIGFVFIIGDVVCSSDGNLTLLTLPYSICTFGLLSLTIFCFSGRRFFLDVAYYWIALGVFHALLFPDTNEIANSADFAYYLVGHLIPPLILFYYMAGRNLPPSKPSFWRAYLSLAVVCFGYIYPLNWIYEKNFFYLIHPPAFQGLSTYHSIVYIFMATGYIFFFFWVTKLFYRYVANKIIILQNEQNDTAPIN